MKSFDCVDKPDCESPSLGDPIERILKRQSERNKEEKSGDLSNIDEIEKFIEKFNKKQNEIESGFELAGTLNREDLPNHFQDLNSAIQDLQKLYSTSTFFLRIYDKKICQKAIHSLQVKFQDLENKLLPKKKFGFKARKNKIEKTDVNNGADKIDAASKNEAYQVVEDCGFFNKTGEDLILKDEEIDRKDVLLSNLKNCKIQLFGYPTTLHIANLEASKVYCGPVSTSVFIEHVKDSTLHLACQQLRIHNTTDSNFYIHVTSKAIIEDSKNVRFGIYKLDYEGIDKHYDSSGLNRNVNNWDKVDDFNWLATDKPSPNWSIIVNSAESV